MNTQRLEKVLKKMETEGLDQMIISDPYAIYYLTGRFIDPGERLLALYINQSGKNKIFINNLFFKHSYLFLHIKLSRTLFCNRFKKRTNKLFKRCAFAGGI